MTYSCPECAAVIHESTSCQKLFESFLALEFTDPEYGEVHFFTVGTFMIQHYRYTDPALDWICQNLRAVLDGSKSILDVREDNPYHSKNRGPEKILRSHENPPPTRIKWKMTIADVADHYEDAAGYCELIRHWADSTLLQLGF